jgi:hypothetical protein
MKFWPNYLQGLAGMSTFDFDRGVAQLTEKKACSEFGQ